MDFSFHQATGTCRLYLHRINLNNSGYDSNGQYFGVGKSLYWYSDGLGISHYLRANDRSDAMKQVKMRYPNAVFYRGENRARA